MPLAFFVLSLLAFLGGAIHAPNNYDGLAYRTPRVLHWLAASQWHWIHTDFASLNTRGNGWEWVSAPLLSLTGSDRTLFLINTICFLLLPGRIFGLFTKLGVSPRLSFYFMWLLPTGYCYLLQAGSIANDLFGAFFAIVAVEFALRARQSGSLPELWIAILAIALATAGKAFNIVLGLPWLLAIFPALLFMLKRPLASAAVIVIGLTASLVPSALLNIHYCHDWSGQSVSNTASTMATGSPGLHVIINALLLLLHNFTPTVFPWANAWHTLMQRVIPPALSKTLHYHFEPFGAEFSTSEMQMEEMAGLGFGFCLLLVVLFVFRKRWLRRRSAAQADPPVSWLSWLTRTSTLVFMGSWLAAIFLMSQSGLACPGRYLAPFYSLLVASLFGGKEVTRGFIRSRAARWMAGGVFVLAFLLVVISPARPLWPAVTVLRHFGAGGSSHALVRRAWTVYSVYAERDDGFRPVRAVLPPDANVIGLVTFDDPETSLWRPFGSRRVVHICVDDHYEQIEKRGVKYALVSGTLLSQHQIRMADWLARTRAELVQTMNLRLRAGTGPGEWFLVKWP
ncbi:MAG TPA: hypothetical protein VLT36_02140 [Candidatus Dormibacteraeota bacterium]|nr:hypothetical protein [Candidatus Dormibacteraeota bacterium]